MACFWSVEATFGCQPGVVRVRAGYMGGDKEEPTYNDLWVSKVEHNVSSCDCWFDDELVGSVSRVRQRGEEGSLPSLHGPERTTWRGQRKKEKMKKNKGRQIKITWKRTQRKKKTWVPLAPSASGEPWWWCPPYSAFRIRASISVFVRKCTHFIMYLQGKTSSNARRFFIRENTGSFIFCACWACLERFPTV